MGSEASWRLYEAKNRLSELLNRVFTIGPQRIRRHHDEVVVISAEEFDRLNGVKQSFGTYLASAGTLEDVDLQRDQSLDRPIDL